MPPGPKHRRSLEGCKEGHEGCFLNRMTEDVISSDRKDMGYLIPTLSCHGTGMGSPGGSDTTHSGYPISSHETRMMTALGRILVDLAGN